MAQQDTLIDLNIIEESSYKSVCDIEDQSKIEFINFIEERIMNKISKVIKRKDKQIKELIDVISLQSIEIGKLKEKLSAHEFITDGMFDTITDKFEKKIHKIENSIDEIYNNKEENEICYGKINNIKFYWYNNIKQHFYITLTSNSKGGSKYFEIFADKLNKIYNEIKIINYAYNYAYISKDIIHAIINQIKSDNGSSLMIKLSFPCDIENINEINKEFNNKLLVDETTIGRAYLTTHLHILQLLISDNYIPIYSCDKIEINNIVENHFDTLKNETYNKYLQDNKIELDFTLILNLFKSFGYFKSTTGKCNNVKQIIYNDKIYLRNKTTDTIYDYQTYDSNKQLFIIGRWNEKENKIEFYV